MSFTNKLQLGLTAMSMTFLFACGGAKTPKPANGQKNFYGSDANGFESVKCEVNNCPPVNLSPQNGVGGYGQSLTAVVNTQADWQIAVTTNPEAINREIQIQVIESGGEGCKGWRDLGTNSASCTWRPQNIGNGTIQVRMLDKSFCREVARANNQQVNCDLDSLTQGGQAVGIHEGQISWSVTEENFDNRNDQNFDQFQMPKVKDQSMLMCALNGLGPLLGSLGGGNILGGFGGAAAGCIQGIAGAKSQKAQMEQQLWQMQQQQLMNNQYNNASGSNYGYP